MAGSIQFKGKEQVISAFENKDVEAWSIFQHKQFIHKGIGSQDLAAFLEMLCQGGTNAIYTLKVYEGIDDLKAIKEKTECDGSFNFRLNDERQEITGGQYYAVNRYEKIQQELEDVKQQLAEKENEQFDDEPETIGAVVNSVVVDVLKNPDRALQWMAVLKELFGQKQPGQFPGVVRQIQSPPPAAVGNVTATIQPAFDEAKYTRIYTAVENLAKADPKLMEHLETLAIMAQDKPAKFKSLLLMLETF